VGAIMVKIITILGVFNKLWPVAVEVAKYVADGKITKDEILEIADYILGEDQVIYLWRRANA
jgi:hypothetical protein